MPEQLLLLALDDEAGTDTLGATLDRGLIAAALLELVHRKQIVRRELGAFPGERLAAHSYPFWRDEATYRLAEMATATGSSYLDHVLTTIAANSAGDWLHTFSTLTLVYLGRTNPLSPAVYAAPPSQRLLAAHDLMAREQLIATETRFLFLRRTHLPQSNRPTGEGELRQQLRDALPTGFALADERLRALLLLIKATGLIADVWGDNNHDAADWRIAQTLQLTMQSRSLLADAYRYVRAGITEEDLALLNGSYR